MAKCAYIKLPVLNFCIAIARLLIRVHIRVNQQLTLQFGHDKRPSVQHYVATGRSTAYMVKNMSISFVTHWCGAGTLGSRQKTRTRHSHPEMSPIPCFGSIGLIPKNFFLWLGSFTRWLCRIRGFCPEPDLYKTGSATPVLIIGGMGTELLIVRWIFRQLVESDNSWTDSLPHWYRKPIPQTS